MKSADQPILDPVERSFSLSHALQAVLRDSGRVIDGEDLKAALGLPLMVCAPADPDEKLSAWPMYARDAYLIEAGRLFGLGVRDLHPPEAARGLTRTEVFRQHFEASYRPLIERALENGQRVLAWQGWPGEAKAMWGLIRRTCQEGAGVAGVTLPSASAPTGIPDVTLVRPPVQLYVIETITPTAPSADDLLTAVLDHARGVLTNACGPRFGVVTGPEAYEAWRARVDSWEADGAGRAETGAGHRFLAASVVAGHESAIRFLKGQLEWAESETRARITALTTSCHKIVTALSPSLDATAAGTMLTTPPGRARLTEQLAHARDAAAEMRETLKSRQ